jgi:hypothetical protein
MRIKFHGQLWFKLLKRRINMDVIILEKGNKIGEVYGKSIKVWQLFHILLASEFQNWCLNRGYQIDWGTHTIGTDIRFQKYSL